MSETSENPVWKAEEDEFCIWFFFCAPQGSFYTIKNIPGGKTAQELQEHFPICLKDPISRERVRQMCHGDIFSAFIDVPFTPIEDYTIINSSRLLHKFQAIEILRNFGIKLHLSRTKSSINNEKFLLFTKGKYGYDIQLKLFREFKNNMIKNYEGRETIPLDLSVETVSSHFVNASSANKIFADEIGSVIDELDNSAQENFISGQLAALRGKSGCLFITKPTTYIGRNSQFINVDIDLTPYQTKTVSRRHAVIKMCNDLNFYIECLGSNLIINGKVILNGEKALIKHRDVIDIGGCLFIFLERVKFMNKIRKMQDQE